MCLKLSLCLSVMLVGWESRALAATGADGKANDAPASARAIARGGNAFALDLYGKLAAAGQPNVFVSPFSVSTALAMVSAGARGETLDEMRQVLHLRDQPVGDALHAAHKSLLNELNARAAAADRAKPADPLQLHVANALWGQDGYPFHPQYVRLTQDSYGGGLREANFLGQPEAARRAMNAWAAEQTRDKIKDLMPPGSITPLTRLALVNAVYFKGTWRDKFDERATQDAAFHVGAGNNEVKVRMMNRLGQYRYGEDEAVQILELPYAAAEGQALTMLILLPKRGVTLERIEKQLSGDGAPDVLDRWLELLSSREVQASIPRFTFASQTDLVRPLKELGMKRVFSDQADLSGIATQEKLQLSAAVHKAFVDVNEEGTEAAGATGLTVTAVSATVSPRIVFTADHPFLLMIRDERTSAILFLGRLVNPSG